MLRFVSRTGGEAVAVGKVASSAAFVARLFQVGQRSTKTSKVVEPAPVSPPPPPAAEQKATATGDKTQDKQLPAFAKFTKEFLENYKKTKPDAILTLAQRNVLLAHAWAVHKKKNGIVTKPVARVVGAQRGMRLFRAQQNAGTDDRRDPAQASGGHKLGRFARLNAEWATLSEAARIKYVEQYDALDAAVCDSTQGFLPLVAFWAMQNAASLPSESTHDVLKRVFDDWLALSDGDRSALRRIASATEKTFRQLEIIKQLRLIEKLWKQRDQIELRKRKPSVTLPLTSKSVQSEGGVWDDELTATKLYVTYSTAAVMLDVLRSTLGNEAQQHTVAAAPAGHEDVEVGSSSKQATIVTTVTASKKACQECYEAALGQLVQMDATTFVDHLQSAFARHRHVNFGSEASNRYVAHGLKKAQSTPETDLLHRCVLAYKWSMPARGARLSPKLKIGGGSEQESSGTAAGGDADDTDRDEGTRSGPAVLTPAETEAAVKKLQQAWKPASL